MNADSTHAEAIATRLAQLGFAPRIRFMIGGWLLYVDDVLVGQIQAKELFLKETSFAQQNFAACERTPPYPGAKDSVLVAAATLGDDAALKRLIRGTKEALQQRTAPKNR